MTYLGVLTWGTSIEANPIIGTAMSAFGPGTTLAVAKLIAMGFGIVLHLQLFHTAVAVLTGFYVAVSIVPWTALFLVWCFRVKRPGLRVREPAPHVGTSLRPTMFADRAHRSPRISVD